jgi:hypothetical protein
MPVDANPYMSNSPAFNYANIRISDILNNINGYINLIDGSNLINKALHVLLTALYMQNDSTHVVNFEELFDQFIEQAFENDIWKKNDDITINSMFIFVILQGICQIKIKGGVSESRFYYEEMKISGLIGANMPSYWKQINCSLEQKQFTTLNII